MKRYSIVVLMVTAAFMFQNCAASKQKSWLNAHQTELARLANGNMPAEEKMDGMITIYAVLMEQGLQFIDPIKGGKYIRKFQMQNQASIEKILADGNKWMNGMDDFQTVGFGFRMVQKPYVRQFIDLVPKFKRKYETYKFILEMTGKVAGGFGKIGAKVFGL